MSSLARRLGAAALLVALLAACSGEGGTAAVASSTTATTSATTTTSTTTTTTTAPTTTTTTTTAPTTTTTTLPEGFPAEGRVNILVLGSDGGIGRRPEIRTDVMMVVSIDPETGWVAMFGIPRNLWRLPIPPGHPAQGTFACGDCFDRIAWDVYAWGEERPDLFGADAPGANAAKTMFGYLLGIDIHYFAMVNLQGFEDVVDALGGVQIEATFRIYEPLYTYADGTSSEIDLLPGIHQMDGPLALFYARSRTGSDDHNRMGRQRCVLQALATQADPAVLLGMVDMVRSMVVTDLPVSAIVLLIGLLDDANLDEIVSIRFWDGAPEMAGTGRSYIKGWTADRYPIPDREVIAQTVATALSLPPAEAIATLNLQPLAAVCGNPTP